MSHMLLLQPLPFLLIVLFFFSSAFPRASCAPSLVDRHHLHNGSIAYHKFREINTRILADCKTIEPTVQIRTSAGPGTLSDDMNVTVTVSGVSKPSKDHWVGMLSPPNSNVNKCPLVALLYKETGDLSNLPLICHYPVKAATLATDPGYLSCNKSACTKQAEGGDASECDAKTCSGSVTFHVINIRTDIEFIFFSGGFGDACVMKRAPPLRFTNPNKPLYGHLSSIDSSGTSMRLTWVSGSKNPQQVQYENGKSQASTVRTFTDKDMCGKIAPSAAKGFGWHDPGFVHTAVMTGLKPSTNFTYRYGSNPVGWSDRIVARTPPAGGSGEVRILAFGDMGKGPLDSSVEHYIQPGAVSVTSALANEVATGKFDAIFHIGDISYATGFLVEWDYFLHLIGPAARRVSYMTAIGNHERDYPHSGAVYQTPDSGGECGVPYETYFQMPTSGKDKPWYSIEMGSVHFTVVSTENQWKPSSEQHEWMKKDMASVNRSRTPWLIFAGHRPMYTTAKSAITSVDPLFVERVEPLLLQNKVDLAIFAHVHNYERMCAIYRASCKAKPTKDAQGKDTYNNANYSAPVQVVMGMAGFKLDDFGPIHPGWSITRISKYGYTRIHATREELNFEFVNSQSKKVEDSFRITKKVTKV